jgi:hypothetical protein
MFVASRVGFAIVLTLAFGGGAVAQLDVKIYEFGKKKGMANPRTPSGVKNSSDNQT